MSLQISRDSQFYWVVSNVHTLKETGPVVSPEYSTGPVGYKFKLTLFLQGDGSGKHTHLSLYLSLHKGEFDELLPWPCPYKFTLELVNLTDIDHLSSAHREISFRTASDKNRKCFYQPNQDSNLGYGMSKMVTHKVGFSTEYCRDNKMIVRASFVNLSVFLPKVVPNLHNISDLATDNQVIWIIDYCKDKKQLDFEEISPKFTTEKQRYSFELGLYLNGFGAGRDSHVSLFMSLVTGVHDDVVAWPCPITFILELVNLNDFNNRSIAHRELNYATASPATKNCFQKPNKDSNSDIGQPKLITHKYAFNNDFCINDKMVVRVTFE